MLYFIEQHPNHFILIQSIFNYIQREDIEIITSTLTLTELLVKPIQAENVYLQREYRNIVMNTQNISPIIINADIAINAAELRATYNLKTPDALHVATVIVSGANAFLTNDKGFKRIEEIAILILDELEI